MGNIGDAIKGFINKHFTQEVTCCNCGKTGKIITFSTLEDGNRICRDCKREIPSQFDFTPKETTFEEYKELYEFVQHSKNILKPMFSPAPAYSYGTFEVDPIHNLCRVDDSFVFEIKNIAAYDFLFKAEEFKDGVFSSKVKGDVYLTALILEKPFAKFDETVIKFGAKGKAEKKLLSNTVIYSNPTDMDTFVANFASLWNKFQEEKKEKELQDLVEKKAQELLEKREAENG